jgi:hypothetical protein
VDLIRPVRRATLTALKDDAALTALIPAANIHPATQAGDAPWPFMRWDAPSATPLTWGATVSFRLHVFGRPVFNGGGAMTETAEDFVLRALGAARRVVHRNRVPLTGGSVRLWSDLTRAMPDGAERDAWHGIIAVTARAFAE